MLIQLRILKESDLPNVQKHASHPEISRLSYVPSPYPDDGAQTWFAHVRPKIESVTAKVYVIEFNNEFCGIMALNNYSKVERSTDVDYWVRADFQGKGIATAALSRAVNLAVEQGISRIKSGCLAKNVGSKKVLINNGFSLDTSFTLQHGPFKGEEMLLFSILQTEQ